MPRPPVLIWRALLSELGRLALLTTAVLVGIIAFAGAVRPLADGQIGPGDALLLMVLLAIPMLQFALPFAGGFAATMSYHRFAAENEAMAASAAGIGHRSLLAPAAGLGLVLAVFLGVLTFEAIPRFLLRAERVVERDIARLLVAPIDRGRSIRLGGIDIHAERVVELDPRPESGAAQHLVLMGVVAVEAGDAGPPDAYSAERVDVWLFEDDEDREATTVQLVFSNAASTGEAGEMEQRAFSTRRLRIATPFADDPKFLPFTDLMTVTDEPRRMSSVDRRARDLGRALVRAGMLGTLDRSARGARRLELTGPDGREVLVGGVALAPGDTPDERRLAPSEPGARLTIVTRPPGGRELTQYADAGSLRFAEAGGELAPGAGAPTLTLELLGVVTPDPGDAGVATERARFASSGLTPAGFDAGSILEAPASELLDAADRAPDPAGALEGPAERLRDAIGSLRREVTSKLHERAAFAAACFVMVLTGAVIAMRLRDSLPLPVYLWSFLPALVAVVTITSGQRLVFREGAPGLLLLWGGVVALLAYALFEYGRLRRH